MRSAFKAVCAYKLACSLYAETQNKGCTRGFQRGNHPSAAKEEVELEVQPKVDQATGPADDTHVFTPGDTYSTIVLYC
jgi:hypothetical protein